MVHQCIYRFYLDVLKANEQKLTNLKSHLKHFLCSRFNFQYFYLVIWTILPRIIYLLIYTKTINQYNIYRIWYILSFLQFTERACGLAGTESVIIQFIHIQDSIATFPDQYFTWFTLFVNDIGRINRYFPLLYHKQYK